MQLRFQLTAISALTLSLAAPSLAAVIPAGTQLHATQTIIRNNGSEPETLDPAVAESVGANNITRDLFEGLTANDSDGKLVPGVAESWKQTNPTTWVFKLRTNAKWSNGDPSRRRTSCTASAALWTPKPRQPMPPPLGLSC
jgi:oligopeptide transport system substrate-binding protein